MAAFNTVSVTRLTPCPRCADGGTIRLQFGYGDTWQHDYQLNDSVRWGGNDVGTRTELAEVLGYPEDCPVCGLAISGEYVLTIDHDKLTAYRLAEPEDIARIELAGEP
jgi:hypothetical protein